MTKKFYQYKIKEKIEELYQYATPLFKARATELLTKELETRFEWKRMGLRYWKDMTQLSILVSVLEQAQRCSHQFANIVRQELSKEGIYEQG